MIAGVFLLLLIAAMCAVAAAYMIGYTQGSSENVDDMLAAEFRAGFDDGYAEGYRDACGFYVIPSDDDFYAEVDLDAD